MQDQRARERKQHKRRLLHQSVDLAHVEDDARKDFMEARQHHRIQHVLEEARLGPGARARKLGSEGQDTRGGDEDDDTMPGLDDPVYLRVTEARYT